MASALGVLSKTLVKLCYSQDGWAPNPNRLKQGLSQVDELRSWPSDVHRSSHCTAPGLAPRRFNFSVQDLQEAAVREVKEESPLHPYDVALA